MWSLGQFIATVILGAYLGLWLHEGTHYMFSKMYGGSPRVIFWPRYVPKVVAFETSERMSNNQIRIAGGATIVWLLFGIGAILVIKFPETPFEVVIVAIAVGALSFSPSDLLALVYPDSWREFGEDDDEATHFNAIKYLWRNSKKQLYNFR